MMVKGSKDIEEWVILGLGGPKSDVDLKLVLKSALKSVLKLVLKSSLLDQVIGSRERCCYHVGGQGREKDRSQ